MGRSCCMVICMTNEQKILAAKWSPAPAGSRDIKGFQMDLSQQLSSTFTAVCGAYRDGGYTDISLTSNGKSFLRGPAVLTPVNSPTEAAITHLVEVLIGKEQMENIMDGGDASITWNDMQVSVAKVSETAPFHVVIRL